MPGAMPCNEIVCSLLYSFSVFTTRPVTSVSVTLPVVNAVVVFIVKLLCAGLG